MLRLQESTIVLYTFNPYTYLAPKFWKESEDNRFTKGALFQHPFESPQYFETPFAHSKYVESVLKNLELIKIDLGKLAMYNKT